MAGGRVCGKGSFHLCLYAVAALHVFAIGGGDFVIGEQLHGAGEGSLVAGIVVFPFPVIHPFAFVYPAAVILPFALVLPFPVVFAAAAFGAVFVADAVVDVAAFGAAACAFVGVPFFILMPPHV